MFLLCVRSKQKLTRFPKVDHCACSFSLCEPKVPIYTASTKAINADEWLAMASLFGSSQRRKFPLSLLHLHSITLTGPAHSTAFALEQGSVYLSVSNMKEKWKIIKSGEKPLVVTHKLPSFILLLIVVPTCAEHTPLEQSGPRKLQCWENSNFKVFGEIVFYYGEEKLEPKALFLSPYEFFCVGYV